MGSCLICSEKVPDPDLVEHLRLMHPDQYEPSGEWPGGRPVRVDKTLNPADFEEPSP